MSSRPLTFKLETTDGGCQARAGVIHTPHGQIRTPVFMPVGTQGAIRNLSPDQVNATGAQIILANTYHMSIRPGEDLVKKAGGLHRFMGYQLPILTDSGGFQVFSLPKKKIDDDGVRFQYEVDGQELLLTPERSMEIQQALGADIAMVFDECAPYPCSYEYAVEALERTTRWEQRSKLAHTRPDQALFGIVQGSVFPDLRRRSAREIISIGFDGYAIGGLSVGEGLDIMCQVLDWTVPELPENKPRYLMGVGLPEDVLAAVERGIDMMDCVIPTRHARGGILYTFQGRMRIQHSRYRRDMFPIDTRCTCYTCQNFSRAYLRHLFTIREVLANTLASIHNIHFYQTLMARARAAILDGSFVQFKRQFLEQYMPGDLESDQPRFSARDMELEESGGGFDDEPSERRSKGKGRNRSSDDALRPVRRVVAAQREAYDPISGETVPVTEREGGRGRDKGHAAHQRPTGHTSASATGKAHLARKASRAEAQAGAEGRKGEVPRPEAARGEGSRGDVTRGEAPRTDARRPDGRGREGGRDNARESFRAEPPHKKGRR